MSRNFKNIIKLRRNVVGKERRENLAKEVLQDSTPLPKPVEYEDIDKEFERWVSEDLDISFEEQKLPTYLMLSNQRFSEYMQSWQNVDEKKNLILNFKTITRENNPKLGSIVGDTRNIPGDIDFLMKRVQAVDKSGHKYFIDYRVKQPISIDLIYTVSIFTNKYQLLNEFNMIMNEKFKSINCYIRPNGHFMPMKLTDISDESEYNIDDRRYYSQSYEITVMAYIMPKDSFRVVELPSLVLESFEGDKIKRSKTTVFEGCDDKPYNPYEYKDVEIKTEVARDSFNGKFTIDFDAKIYNVGLINVRYFEMFVNDKQIDFTDYFTSMDKTCYQEDKIEVKSVDESGNIVNYLKLNTNDVVKFKNISRYKTMDNSEIILYGKDLTELNTENETC